MARKTRQGVNSHPGHGAVASSANRARTNHERNNVISVGQTAELQVQEAVAQLQDLLHVGFRRRELHGPPRCYPLVRVSWRREQHLLDISVSTQGQDWLSGFPCEKTPESWAEVKFQQLEVGDDGLPPRTWDAGAALYVVRMPCPRPISTMSP